ncbi:MAG: (4Fe-4S)-binding protein, partial [Candidatus Krumholzibacteriota bacterium]|nr:(4Fe-4S)-binding protein [Candidatus Krumholzibacteriota bacterium]
MSEDTKPGPSIKPATDGPYLVTNLETFRSAKGSLECKPRMALCRCGDSKNKPFCDGSHATNGFSSARLEERVEDKRDSYEKDDLTIHDNRGICSHAGVCTDGLPAVFRLKQEPFVDPGGASRDEIVATLQQCPSGALSYSRGGVEHRDGEGDPAIFVPAPSPRAKARAERLQKFLQGTWLHIPEHGAGWNQRRQDTRRDAKPGQH